MNGREDREDEAGDAVLMYRVQDSVYGEVEALEAEDVAVDRNAERPAA